MELDFGELRTITDVEKAIKACEKNLLLATIGKQLEGYRATLQAKIDEEMKWYPFIELTNTTLGELPAFTPDWRLQPSCQSISVVTRAVVDEEAEAVIVPLANGESEARKPQKLVRQVILGTEVTNLPATKSSATNPIRKKAITVYRLGDMSQPPSEVGNFRNGEEACKFLNIDTKGDSAPRKLQSAGYLTKQYEGTNFTVSES